MSIFRDFFNVKQSPIFTGLKFGFGGGGAGVIPEDPFTASGGTESTPGDGYIYHVFDYVYPHSHNFTCTAPSAGVTVEVMCQGSGGGGGSRSNPGPSTKPSAGGNGGATGVWDLIISAPGNYPVTVGQGSVSTFHGSPMPDAGKDGNPRSSSRITNASNPSQYIQGSNGARGGFNGNPDSYGGPAGPAATSLTNWSAATNTGDFQPQVSIGPSGNPEFSGPLWMPGRPAGGVPQSSSLWWRPYISPGASGGGPQGGNGSNYGGGGGGYETGQPPGTDNGSGGNGRVVIRYLASLIE